jgi:hypothetical protein
MWDVVNVVTLLLEVLTIGFDLRLVLFWTLPARPGLTPSRAANQKVVRSLDQPADGQRVPSQAGGVMLTYRMTVRRAVDRHHHTRLALLPKSGPFFTIYQSGTTHVFMH